ncbi:hypothetical protein Q7P37_005419 [Cladosporium fusiforme]
MATDDMYKGWVADDASSAEGKMIWKNYTPKVWEESDIEIKITHSGVCGSDLHTLRSGWSAAPYPIVVGHEIVGVAVRVGSEAEGEIEIGDIVGVGAQADACLNRDPEYSCLECHEQSENYCAHRIGTYADKHRNGSKSQGGYALFHRAPSHFVVKIPTGLAPEFAAPMLCAGGTVFSPLKQYATGPGKKIGIIGIGGLGHFAILFAKALGAEEVVGLSRRSEKRKDAIDLGCDSYIATEDDENWSTKHARRFDLILNTVASNKVCLDQDVTFQCFGELLTAKSSPLLKKILLTTLSSTQMPLAGYLGLLQVGGTLVQVGLPEGKIPFRISALGGARYKIAGTYIAAPSELREMLRVAVANGIKPWIEQRPMADANGAILDLAAGRPRFRYVLVN